jgi:hypothetical protein
MPDAPNGHTPDPVSLLRDNVTQMVILMRAVAHRRQPKNLAEITSDLIHDPASPEEREALAHAVTELVEAGLLLRHDFRNKPDGLVVPSRSTLHFCWMWGWSLD